MSTSLAEQLKRLALPQTSILIRDDKKRPSLLFDPKEAAGIRKDTFYQIGLEGLEELIEIDVSFEIFKHTLYYHTSKDFERAVETSEANKKLDKNISTFLLKLSPYFMLNSAHKALEWLINRYMINEYNREDLLMLILPYHESNIFVRVVQLLKFKDHNDPWYFLGALQKPGVHLTKQQLFNYAASNTGFLKFVTKFIKKLIKVHENPQKLTLAFNFYCSMCLGVLEFSKKVSEDQISQMLPLLLKGLRSNIPDFCAASYVIAARLFMKATLTPVLLNSLVEKITEFSVSGLKSEACMALIVLYQTQLEYATLPVLAVQNLIKRNWLPIILEEFNQKKFNIYPFLEIFIKSSVKEGCSGDSELARNSITNLFDKMKFDDKYIANILNSILDALKTKKAYSTESKQWLNELVHTLERQYPQAFDKIIYEILSVPTKKKKTIRRRALLQKILTNSNLYKTKFNIFNQLYHSNATTRQQAIKSLKNSYEKFTENDLDFVKKSFIDRLHDDDVTVVKECLEMVKKTKILKEDDLVDKLLPLASKCKKNLNGFKELQSAVLQLLCSNARSNDWRVFLAIFPFLLPCSVEELTEAHRIISTKFCTQNQLFKNFITQLEDCTKHEEFGKIIFNSLLQNSDLGLIREFIVVLKGFPEDSKDCLFLYASTMILTNILPKNSSMELGCAVLEIILTNYKQSQKTNKGKSNVYNQIKWVVQDKFPISGFVYCLNILLEKIDLKPKDDLVKVDFFSDQAQDRFLVLFANSSGSFFFNETFQVFLEKLSKNVVSQAEFLLNLCCSNNKLLNLQFYPTTLNFVKNKLEYIKNEFTIDFIIFFTILLTRPEKQIRQLTCNLIQNLVDFDLPEENLPCVLVLKQIVEDKEEILTDHQQVITSFQKLLHPANTRTREDGKLLNLVRTIFVNRACDVSYPSYFQVNILKLLSEINTQDIFTRTVLPAIKLLGAKSLDENTSEIIRLNINRIALGSIKKQTLDSEVWKFIFLALKSDSIELKLENPTVPTILTLSQLNKEIFAGVSQDIQIKLLDSIIEVATLSLNTLVRPAASKLFKKIELNCANILEHLDKMFVVRGPKQPISTRTGRVSSIPTLDVLETLDWRKGVTVLEFIQDKKRISNMPILLPVMFKLLKRCLDFDEQTAVEYPKQLILTFILHCVTMEQPNIAEEVLEAPLIVQCIRGSPNPQTHHYALLVLTKISQMIPGQILQHIIPIFTFVGFSVLRFDDSYSFQIIEKIIDTIIPILLIDNEVSTISKVLRKFVDALLDVPEHRRTPLYKQLLQKISPEKNLYLFLLLIFESQVVHNLADKQANLGSRRLDIAGGLSREFNPKTVINTCIKLISYLQKLPVEKLESVQVPEQVFITFNINTYSAKQFRHYKFVLITFISNLLSSKEFVQQVAGLNNKEIIKLEASFKEIIVNILTYIQKTVRVSELKSSTPQAQYWKTILHYSYDILDSTNALLTPEMFLLVTKGLMVHTLPVVRRRILELLNTKLQFNSSFFADCKRTELYALIPTLTKIIETIDKGQLESDQEQIVQVALLTLKLLVKFLAPENPEQFIPILTFITSLIKSEKAEKNILASAVLCLAELCVNLRAHAISGLPDFMPALIKALKHQKSEETTNVLLLSLLTSVHKIFDCLPLFLSPYLEKLLLELSSIMTKFNNETADAKLQPFINKLQAIKEKIGLVIPSRILIPAVESCYNLLIAKKNYHAIKSLMELLGENIQNLKGPDITANLPELTSFFLNALQFRTSEETSLEEANEIESDIIKSFTILILKLSESTFRPLYYKLFDWAVKNNEVKSERSITFYSLSSGIAESLKGLFVLFAGHFLNNASQIIDSCNKIKNDSLYFEEDPKNILLLEYVLKTLSAIFLYDTQRFVNKDRFEILMQPLVDQLENTLGGMPSLLERSTKLLIPCLVQFSLAVADDSLWKQMNYQILLKMRHSDGEIRLNALHCLTEIVKKVGEDFLPLLPETIPFLAELLEDEDESVEKACQRAVQEMEKVLGEPLQKYF